MEDGAKVSANPSLQVRKSSCEIGYLLFENLILMNHHRIVEEKLTYDVAENSSLAIALNHITFQDANNVFQTAWAEPSKGVVWSNQVIQFPFNDTNLRSLPQSGMAASSIWLGPGQSEPDSLDVFLQVNGSTVMDCLDKQAIFSCKKIPNI